MISSSWWGNSAEQFLKARLDHWPGAVVGSMQDHKSPCQRRTDLVRYVGRCGEETQSPGEAIPTLTHRLRFSGAVFSVTIAQEQHEVAGEGRTRLAESIAVPRNPYGNAAVINGKA